MDVRKEARASFLAYAFLRGKPLHIVERPNSRTPDWVNVKRITKRFSPVPFDEVAFETWAGISQSIKKVA